MSSAAKPSVRADKPLFESWIDGSFWKALLPEASGSSERHRRFLTEREGTGPPEWDGMTYLDPFCLARKGDFHPRLRQLAFFLLARLA